MLTKTIIESIVGVCSVIVLLWLGILIGREFGTFEKFVLTFLEELKRRLD